MAQLIDKDALVAWAKKTYLCENASAIRKVCYKQLVEHLDTLEVKDVDLEKDSLSWEDMLIIHKCIKDAMNKYLYAFQTVEGQQKVYEDVLKLYNKEKKEK